MLDDIRAQVGVDNLTSCCSRDGCEVSLENVPNDRVIVDVDLAFPALEITGERCDFVVFIGDNGTGLVAVPVELKSGNLEIAKLVRQLRRGARFVETIVKISSPPVCRPILIHGRPLSDKNRKRLNRLKVEFMGLELTIKTARCNRPRNLSVALGMQDGQVD